MVGGDASTSLSVRRISSHTVTLSLRDWRSRVPLRQWYSEREQGTSTWKGFRRADRLGGGLLLQGKAGPGDWGACCPGEGKEGRERRGALHRKQVLMRYDGGGEGSGKGGGGR